MVVVNISSGLGNQLFQYAAGRALSLKYEVKLIGDPVTYAPRFKSLTSRSSKRDFILKDFCLPINFRTVPSHVLTGLRGYSRIRRLMLDGYRKKISCSGSYDEQFLLNGSDILLDGYFQDLRYLLNNRDKIIDEISEALRKFMVSVVNTDTPLMPNRVAALHVRRGDYLNHPELHPSWFEKYSMSIAPYLLEEFSLNELHVFTDDERWCLQTFRKFGKKIKIMTADKKYEGVDDLVKMSQYPVLAIANSTFSCWAGYISSSSDTQVIAPSKWSTWCTDPVKSMYLPSWKVFEV